MDELNNNVQEPNNAQIPNQNNGGNQKKGLSGGAIAAIIIGAIVLFAGILVGVGVIGFNLFKVDGGKTGNNKEIVENNNKVVIPEGYEVYENEELGIKFGYPEGFVSNKEDVDNKENAMVSFVNSKTGEAINVVINKVPSGYNNSQYITANINGIKQTIKEDPKVNKSGVKLGGRTANTVEYTLAGTKIYQSITTKDGIGYIFTYGAKPAAFNTNNADEIFATFQFTK